MNSEPINKSSSTRICNHMNKDHQDAVNAYAKYYGKIETFKPAKASKPVAKKKISPKAAALSLQENWQ